MYIITKDIYGQVRNNRENLCQIWHLATFFAGSMALLRNWLATWWPWHHGNHPMGAISWKIPSFEMDENWGYPKIDGKFMVNPG